MRLLFQYLDQVRGDPLVWGRHDCLTFTNRCFSIIHGRGYADDLMGRYVRMGRPIGRERILALLGADSFEGELDRRLSRVRHVPPRGALVTSTEPACDGLDISFGMALGTSAVFLGQDGLILRPIEIIDGAWVPSW